MLGSHEETAIRSHALGVYFASVHCDGVLESFSSYVQILGFKSERMHQFRP